MTKKKQEHNKESPAEVIIWIDCEMTGLGTDDELIEIAVVPTDMELNLLDNELPDHGIDLVIKPTETGMKLLEENSFVLKMHKSSGLYDELQNGQNLEDVELEVLEYIRRFESNKLRALLGGNSVHSDKKFLDKYMPLVASHLHYRLIDVSTIKELSKVWYPSVYANAPDKQSTHRALDDILESINELKYYREHCFK